METTAGNYWRESLSAWAIPDEIINSAPENPWIHPPVMFEIPDVIEDSISHQRAREVLVSGDSVLDIGCGGGIAAFAVVPPATHVIGIDHQAEMLEMFSKNAKDRGVTSETFDGFWPAISSDVPIADVVATHHVVYNVPAIEDFLLAMNSHARKRVVIEMPQRHPLTTAAPLWKHFWNLERPVNPTPEDLMKVLTELGINAHLELWEGSMRIESDLESQANFSRIRLCLPADREGEVLEFLKSQPKIAIRNLATIWWDVDKK
jgi:SAM-dependent methyltransferase